MTGANDLVALIDERIDEWMRVRGPRGVTTATVTDDGEVRGEGTETGIPADDVPRPPTMGVTAGDRLLLGWTDGRLGRRKPVVLANLTDVPIPAVAAGTIALFGGGAAPSGWLLCNGAAVSQATYADLYAVIGVTFGDPGGGNFNLPDLRGRFALGVDGSHALAASGGAIDHTHSTPAHTHPFTQPSAHSNHVFTQPSAHSNHVFTQPSAHSNHVFTQPSGHSNHVFTQPSAHSNHVFTQPSAHGDHAAHGNHAHLLPFQASAATVLRRIASATFGTGGSSTAAISQVTMTADTTSTTLLLSDTESASLTHGAHTNNHSGGAVDAHSAHSGGAVDAHSAHSGGAVDAHSAHSGGAVDAHSAHSGGAVDAHSAHAGGAVDSGGAATTGANNPPFLAVNYIIKT